MLPTSFSPIPQVANTCRQLQSALSGTFANVTFVNFSEISSGESIFKCVMNVAWENANDLTASVLESINDLANRAFHWLNFGDKSSIEVLHDAIRSLLAFDDFQLKLLKAFLAVLCGNVFFIVVAWYFYGNRISQRFLKPGNCNDSSYALLHKSSTHMFTSSLRMCSCIV